VFSPFQQDLSELTISEIELKIAELSRKWAMSGHNPMIQDQLVTFIDIYKVELHSKIAKQQLKAQQSQDSSNSPLDKLINVS
jgi:hypothetical protein